MTEQQRREGEQGWEFYTDLPVGEILRRTRVHFEQSLDEVAGYLRIRASQLEALESGDVSQLPGRVYAIGYVRTYSEYLGLDGDKMVQLFKMQSVGQKEEMPELHFPAPASDSKVPGTMLVIASLLVMTVIGGGWVIMNAGTKEATIAAIPNVPVEMRADTATTDIPPPVQETVAASTAASLPGATVPGALAVATPQDSTAATAVPGDGTAATVAVDAATAAATAAEAVAAVTDPAATASAVPGQPVDPATGVAAATTPTESLAVPPAPPGRQIVISVKDRSWVEIRDKKGKALVSRILKPGETIVVPEENYGLRLDTGNAGGLELSINGEVIPALGRPGDILRGITLDEESLKNRPAVEERATAPARTAPSRSTSREDEEAIRALGLRE
ncbi:helix-turn-helix domain-containing protein [Micavibrio aeruginosavorus]|uniref:helix-turn-helix domain-containing protein n=1 Tax=Micavibrio aeruginosavorus TaxID=349221 RepID=UPI000673E014|nr:RodZ domain-containing protein [Micavibrio aeruginosavorus]